MKLEVSHLQQRDPFDDMQRQGTGVIDESGRMAACINQTVELLPYINKTAVNAAKFREAMEANPPDTEEASKRAKIFKGDLPKTIHRLKRTVEVCCSNKKLSDEVGKVLDLQIFSGSPDDANKKCMRVIKEAQPHAMKLAFAAAAQDKHAMMKACQALKKDMKKA